MEDSPIFISAGDPSGDTASARLAVALRELNPQVRFLGLGGTRLARLGQQQFADPEDLAVIGFWEVAKRYGFFRRLFKRCLKEIEQQRPRAVILVDYPGFNLRLARRIKPLGIPVIYYITPQVWAWGRGRVAQLRQFVDLALVILPFEQRFMSDNGINAEYVGHYLLEDIPTEYIASTVPETATATLALMPGSRPQEIERMLVPMLETARLFNRKHGTKAVVAALKGRYNYDPYIERYAGDNIEFRFDDSRAVIHNSRLVLTASGTATLETAVIGRPMVVIYKTGFLTYQIARRLVKLDKIALVNLVLNDHVVPELIQNEAVPERILAELSRIYEDRNHYETLRQRLNQVPGILGGEGASKRAAELIMNVLDK